MGIVNNKFTPGSLYKNKTYTGFAYDFTDRFYLYQESNGSRATHVAAVNDPIGSVDDLSGNGFHATAQSNNAQRPLWGGNTVGGIGNGTTAVLAPNGNSTFDFSNCTQLTVIACMQTSSSSNQTAFGLGSFNPGDADVSMNSATGGFYVTTMYGVSNNPQTFNNRGSNGASYKVVSAIMDRTQATALTEILSRINGEIYGNGQQAAGASGTATFSNKACTLFNGFHGFFNGNIARIIVIGRLLTTTELFAAEKWVSNGILSIIPEIPVAGTADYTGAPMYGQSLSAGVYTDVEATPVISTSTRFNDLMFTSGVHVFPNGADYSTLISLVESTVSESGNNEGETPCSGIIEMAHELSGDTSGSTPYRRKPFIGWTSGFPALDITALQQGQTQYNKFITAITNAWRRSKEASKSFKIPAVFWMQGETTSSPLTYASDLQVLRTSLDSDIRGLTLQTDQVWLLTYQLDRADIGLQYYTASNNISTHIRVCMPMYHIPHNTDLVHLTPSSYKICGAYFAYAYDQIITKGNTAWLPLQVTSYSTVGTTCTLTLNSVGNLVVDTTLVSSQTNKGFKMYQADGTTAITVNSVTLSGTNQIVVTANVTIPAGAILRYGFSDPTDHNAGTAKGNIRDSQGDTVVFNGGGLNYALHNWLLLHQLTIS